MENYLYFAQADVETGADSASEAITVPASSYLFADPVTDATTAFFFKSILGSDYGMQKVVLTHTANKNKEVIKGVLACMNAHPSKGGFVIVANANVAALTTGAEYNAVFNGLGLSTVAITQDVVGAQGGTGDVYLPEMTWGAAATAISAGALLANTNYTNAETDPKAYTLPSAAAGKKGDWITVLYIADIGTTDLHSYHSTTDTQFVLGSKVIVRGTDGTRVAVVDISVADDDEVKITGLDNADGGIGTQLRFVNTTGAVNGWMVETIVEGQGAQTVASATTGFAA